MTRSLEQDLFEQTVSINLHGAFYATQAAAKQMASQSHGGSIIGISSISALVGGAQQTHYTPTKAGVLSLMQSLACALGKYKIRCNALLPGTIKTQLNEKDLADDKKREYMEARIPLGRTGVPEDLAGPAVFLASDLSAYVVCSKVFPFFFALRFSSIWNSENYCANWPGFYGRRAPNSWLTAGFSLIFSESSQLSLWRKGNGFVYKKLERLQRTPILDFKKFDTHTLSLSLLTNYTSPLCDRLPSLFYSLHLKPSPMFFSLPITISSLVTTTTYTPRRRCQTKSYPSAPRRPCTSPTPTRQHPSSSPSSTRPRDPRRCTPASRCRT